MTLHHPTQIKLWSPTQTRKCSNVLLISRYQLFLSSSDSSSQSLPGNRIAPPAANFDQWQTSLYPRETLLANQRGDLASFIQQNVSPFLCENIRIYISSREVRNVKTFITGPSINNITLYRLKEQF